MKRRGAPAAKKSSHLDKILCACLGKQLSANGLQGPLVFKSVKRMGQQKGGSGRKRQTKGERSAVAGEWDEPRRAWHY